MTSINQQKTIEKKSKKTITYIVAIISLGITTTLIVLIVVQIQSITQNGISLKILIFIGLESILIFLLPCIFKPEFALRRILQPFSRGDQIQSQMDDLIPLPPLEFVPEHHHPIIIKCPVCHFENPGNRKQCLNCGSDLIW